jgi:hypothetical protein
MTEIPSEAEHAGLRDLPVTAIKPGKWTEWARPGPAAPDWYAAARCCCPLLLGGGSGCRLRRVFGRGPVDGERDLDVSPGGV